jgi:hypothetical protein
MLFVSNACLRNTVVTEPEVSTPQSQALDILLGQFPPPSILSTSLPKIKLSEPPILVFQVEIFQEVSSPEFCIHLFL